MPLFCDLKNKKVESLQQFILHDVSCMKKWLEMRSYYSDDNSMLGLLDFMIMAHRYALP